MFDHCATLDQLAKEGPVERPELDEALAEIGRTDMSTARIIAEERMRSGTIKEAARRTRKRLP